MQRITYLLVYPLLYIVSVLPLPLVYFFSDMAYFLLFYVVGYRRKTVLQNLQLAFPEKDTAALLEIRRKFYHHLCDTFIEMIRLMNMNREVMACHYKITNIELLKDIERTKSILIVCSHYANWEWNVSINNYVNSKGYAVYQKIGNKYFDQLVRRIRSRFNTTLIPQTETVRTVVRNHKLDIRAIYGMVSDQSPMVSRAQYWSKFMGVKVPIFNGPEMLARKLDLAVVFARVTKVKRGYYSLELIPITLNGASTTEGEITEKFLELTENLIREKPEHYLWTHKRWKHRDKAPVSKKSGSSA